MEIGKWLQWAVVILLYPSMLAKQLIAWDKDHEELFPESAVISPIFHELLVDLQKEYL